MTPLADALIRSTLVLLAGFAAVFVLRHRSAALRHWILAATIASAALAPPLAWMLPAWPATAVQTPSALVFEHRSSHRDLGGSGRGRTPDGGFGRHRARDIDTLDSARPDLGDRLRDGSRRLAGAPPPARAHLCTGVARHGCIVAPHRRRGEARVRHPADRSCPPDAIARPAGDVGHVQTVHSRAAERHTLG